MVEHGLLCHNVSMALYEMGPSIVSFASVHRNRLEAPYMLPDIPKNRNTVTLLVVEAPFCWAHENVECMGQFTNTATCGFEVSNLANLHSWPTMIDSVHHEN